MDIKEFATQVQKISGHSASCGGHCILTGEQKLCGLASTLSFQCSKCKCVFKIESSKTATLNDGSDGWMVNVAAVLGQVTTGGGLFTSKSNTGNNGGPRYEEEIIFQN